MSLDSSAISYVLRSPRALLELRRAGVGADHFVEPYDEIWHFLVRQKQRHGEIPSRTMVEHRFDEFDMVRVNKSDLPYIIEELDRRKRFLDFTDALSDVTRRYDSPEDVDSAISELQGELHRLAIGTGVHNLANLFSREVSKRIYEDFRKRKSGDQIGIKTHLKRFNAVTGGLHKGRLVTTIGRAGQGKTWQNLFLVASAVSSGARVILYPLEMTLEETAYRLYTIFSSQLFGPNRALRNLDLHQGNIAPAKIRKLMKILEERYGDNLLVADLRNSSVAYTIEQVESEVDIHRPDMFWIDYLTLMKTPGRFEKSWEMISYLSSGAKRIGITYDCIAGVSAQVNREAIRTTATLPRLEHIAYGDALGQDADHVISIAKPYDAMFYAMVKNRHGPEFGKTRVKFGVDYGVLEEEEDQDNDE